jgi:hypothetical protein
MLMLASSTTIAACGSARHAPAKAPPAKALMPAVSQQPAAGICPASGPGSLVTVYVAPDTPEPRCVGVRANQHLMIVNRTNASGHPARTITITWPPYAPRRLIGNESTVFTRSFGSYLAPGVHQIGISLYKGGGAEIWLKH